MPHYLLAVILFVIPVFLLTIPFLILSHILSKPKKSLSSQNNEPDVTHLETELKKLIENNTITSKDNLLQQNLQSSFVHTTAAYLKSDKHTLHGFHLFQLIFSLIKNKTEDKKIIKILRRYLPSTPTAHLYVLLKSCKEFLVISHQDNKEKELLRSLNQNHLKPSLIYLEHKINQSLNKIPLSSAPNQQNIIDNTVKLSLIFASFSQFYDTKTTEKILQMAHLLSPDFFNYWHQIPQKNITKNAAHLSYRKNRT